MAVKKTIAIVASENETAMNIVKKLAGTNFRLLVISKDKNQFSRAFTKLRRENPKAELIIQDCVKDGCWEADIIILCICPGEAKEVGQMIREVATQKIVIVMHDNAVAANNLIESLKIVIPYSKVINAFNVFESSETFIENKDNADLQLVLDILKNEVPFLIKNNITS